MRIEGFHDPNMITHRYNCAVSDFLARRIVEDYAG